MLWDAAQFFHFQLLSLSSSFDWNAYINTQYSQLWKVSGAKLQTQKFMVMHKCLAGPERANRTFPIHLSTLTQPNPQTLLLSLCTAIIPYSYFCLHYLNTTGPYLGYETLCAVAVQTKRVPHIGKVKQMSTMLWHFKKTQQVTTMYNFILHALTRTNLPQIMNPYGTPVVAFGLFSLIPHAKNGENIRTGEG